MLELEISRVEIERIFPTDETQVTSKYLPYTAT